MLVTRRAVEAHRSLSVQLVAWAAPPSIWLRTPSGLITRPTSTAIVSRHDPDLVARPRPRPPPRNGRRGPCSERSRCRGRVPSGSALAPAGRARRRPRSTAPGARVASRWASRKASGSSTGRRGQLVHERLDREHVEVRAERPQRRGAQRRLGQAVAGDAPRADVVDRRARCGRPAAGGRRAGRPAAAATARRGRAGGPAAPACAGEPGRGCGPGPARRRSSRRCRPLVEPRRTSRSSPEPTAPSQLVGAGPAQQHRAARDRAGEQHRVEGGVVGAVVAVAAGVLDVLDHDVARVAGRERAAIASRSREMPWLWSTRHVHAVRRSQRATPQLGAIEAWARNGREYDALDRRVAGRAARLVEDGSPRGDRSGGSRAGRRLVGERSRSSQACSRGAAAPAARSTSASRVADHAEERAVAHHVDARRAPVVRRRGRSTAAHRRRAQDPAVQRARRAAGRRGTAAGRGPCRAGRAAARCVPTASAATGASGLDGGRGRASGVEARRCGRRTPSTRRRRGRPAPRTTPPTWASAGPVWSTDMLPAVSPWSGPSAGVRRDHPDPVEGQRRARRRRAGRAR